GSDVCACDLDPVGATSVSGPGLRYRGRSEDDGVSDPCALAVAGIATPTATAHAAAAPRAAREIRVFWLMSSRWHGVPHRTMPARGSLVNALTGNDKGALPVSVCVARGPALRP